MIILVAAVLLFGVLVGAAAQLPVSASLVGGALVATWLLVFAVRERRPARRAGR
ncbi:hypothetical protein DSC45_04300 [Streptomyces sp. YIM 130001]|uniref:hypothetical protein n=1 Tax=Streptomyces sp. YIM 130001 TaxID=2259644 RepID=UPI000EC9E45C|nr:hypothetical protein [Streptomyces sp. YIM 130001]RII20426.1 hypothetical protein DSC45_04300 [Streptomyces sp. YIM 130001]